MHTIDLTDDELRLVHAALHSYLDDFGHEEADVLRMIKELIAKLPRRESSSIANAPSIVASTSNSSPTSGSLPISSRALLGNSWRAASADSQR